MIHILCTCKENNLPPLREVLPAFTSASILGSSCWSLINCSRSTPTCLSISGIWDGLVTASLAPWSSLHPPSQTCWGPPNSFHVLNDGVRDAPRFHFSIKERRRKADGCFLSQQRSVVYPQQ
ncbi:hypothetical protein PoB_006701200 [Plakobranchus ocellatus]|uniref:Uncharacterized protein n=1 Tax=Plakobranchus ocellatus TaxID=259542 RepID=A0AAV4D8U4_9GAST|nr:hypothetical protein PoB_006701200 [Plakobranchus ocellatus]